MQTLTHVFMFKHMSCFTDFNRTTHALGVNHMHKCLQDLGISQLPLCVRGPFTQQLEKEEHLPQKLAGGAQGQE